MAKNLDLRALPRDFLHNPYPVYAALRELVADRRQTPRRHRARRTDTADPGCSDEVREQMLGLAVNEFLRFESSNQLSNRRTVQATQVNGVHPPAGSWVTLCIGAANRDPVVYENPEQLNLRRTGNKHLAFGFGMHQCVGLSLARLEGHVAIGRFLHAPFSIP
jgi:cytochrome P450